MRDRLNAVQRYKYCLVWSWPSNELEISCKLRCNSRATLRQRLSKKLQAQIPLCRPPQWSQKWWHAVNDINGSIIFIIFIRKSWFPNQQKSNFVILRMSYNVTVAFWILFNIHGFLNTNNREKWPQHLSS